MFTMAFVCSFFLSFSFIFIPFKIHQSIFISMFMSVMSCSSSVLTLTHVKVNALLAPLKAEMDPISGFESP